MRLAKGLHRLGDAVRRRGALGVLSAAGRAALKLGPAGVFRLASGDQPFQSIAVSARPARAPIWPPTLDAQGLIPAAAWERWRKARLAKLAKSGAATPPDSLRLFLAPGDEAAPELEAALAALAADPAVQAVSFDLYRHTDGGVQPMPLPGANPVLLKARDYLHGRVALRAGLAEGQGSPRDKLLRWLDGQTVEAARIGWRHLPLPLVNAAIPDPEMDAAQIQAFARLARPVGAPLAGPVTAILCTRDKGRLARQIVRALLREGPDAVAEVIVVANNTANPYALQTLADIESDPRVRILRRDEPFNFSRLNNAAVTESRAEGPLLFINDDITPVSEDWLATMRARLAEPGTGAVGPLLLYPREGVQHAGMYLRRLGGAGHGLRGAILPEGDPLGLTWAEREVSAVTGAVLLVNRADFAAVGGFDEDLAIALQDVDLCLKLKAAGLRNVFEPKAVLLHMESASVGGIVEAPEVAKQRYGEWASFMSRWGDQVDRDPFHPAGFDPEDESLTRLARP